MRKIYLKNALATLVVSTIVGIAPVQAAVELGHEGLSIQVALALSEPLPPLWIGELTALVAPSEQPGLPVRSTPLDAFGGAMEGLHLAALVRDFDPAEAGRHVAVASVTTRVRDPLLLQQDEGADTELPDPLVSLKTVSLDVSGLAKWSTLEAQYITQSKTEAWAKLVAKASQSDRDNLLEGVNALTNKVTYVNDPKDRWQTPADFFRRGGDCEDYAIAKYFLLLALGQQPGDMRIVMLGATAKAFAHAVLVVATADGPVVLDNLRKHTYSLNREVLSRTVYAFSDAGWWVSVGPAPTMVASK